MNKPFETAAVVLAFAAAVLAPPAAAERELRTIGWSDHAPHDPGVKVVVPGGNGWSALRIAVDSPDGATVTVARLTELEVTEAHYALLGEVRHEDVEGAGYLEMWSIFPDGGRYFSRANAAAGPTRALAGTSGWRSFVLPFYLGDSPQRPATIRLNLVLPGRGTVELGPITLTEYAPGEDAVAAATGAWWDDRTGGLVGGIGGSLLGVLGALIGVLAGLGRARIVVTTTVALVTALGVAALAAGTVAFFGGQPYGVYYPLALGGVLATALGGTALVALPRRYAAIELRRMDALDAS